MIELKINKKNIKNLLKNLRKEDYEELKQTFDIDKYDELIKICKNTKNNMYILATDKNEPICMGGNLQNKINNKKVGQIWLLSACKFQKYKPFKYILKKINYFKNTNDILYNFIYKSNYSSLKWLKKIGFSVIDTNTPDYKLFYYTKGENFDIRYIAS